MTGTEAERQALEGAALDTRETLCREIARSAGLLAMDGFRRREAASIGLKGPQDFLTETDAAVEKHIRARITGAFPDDGFIGEETGGVPAGNVWVVDPIDGTANFARDIPHFCISIAFVTGGRTALGAIYNPALDEFHFARRGRGVARNGKPVSVAGTQGFEAACVEMGWSTRRPLASYLKVMTDVLERGANVRRAASGALGLAYVADGRSDGYIELHMNAWDCLAGLLMVEEAGGDVCAFLEESGLVDGGPVIAAAPGIAGALSTASGIALKGGGVRSAGGGPSRVPA